ncbi:MAG: UDP-N-acetylmuramoyl-tripeptide--D-alanyl-D-alanine ligase [Oscillospiraceae bacterium]|nr:UDP-N-acetylmuramoyl-tripeptide--D-alanyl-D-alanine ligase [Oscillospiraceae bacterium]
MAEFTLSEIISAVGGITLNQSVLPEADLRIRGVCTDSRSVVADDLFVALVGERFDGHDFCGAVADKGVRVILLSKKDSLPESCVGILVEDTLKAYQDLAEFYRIRLGCTVIAVTGSVGKTSTREMIAAAIGSTRKMHATIRNNNNEIGLPATILSAPQDTEVMVLEMGMRQKGEIALLTAIAHPDIAVVTNVGVSHIERLGSREDILAAKMEICEGLGPDGILIINGDDPMLADYVADADHVKWKDLGAVVWTPTVCRRAQAKYCVHSDCIEMTEETTFFDAVIAALEEPDKRIRIELATTGRHHIKNAMFSILCARFIGADLDKVRISLQGYRSMGGRGKIIRTKRFTVCDDAYNASPESMAAAFDSIGILAGERRKIAAIGGILELGIYSAELHDQVGASAAEAGIDRLYVCGEFAEQVREGALERRPDITVFVFDDRESLLGALLPDLRTGDVILVKASHAFGFDTVAAEIINFDGGPDSPEKED